MHVQSVPHNLDKPLVALILLETENKSAEAIVGIITGMLHFVLLEDVECVCFVYKKSDRPLFPYSAHGLTACANHH